ncbi:type I 3-dehydroquinate dehydratase [Opitutaceae bacterium TAV4]|uniref:type I 3-dehydroquinate dehydratase n=1 Tax=Geminisphaera colitermitum TaxID=1148786 RepID=UPI000158C57F|nr:type I 3-dehydroquinate dehydratase [Geminisphaera colitermitum]RRJ97463.1 type I 3-dehydroquinate dehydratase [Opitutaceae bacterium TAV4]RRK01842.1 type I 3-dehydroquinate dehydratase [Opitutaceae bacterium TAV3]
MKKTFLNQSRPVITSLFSGETPRELIAKAANSEFDGAGGVAIELHALRPEFRNRESLQSIIEAVKLPFMFCFYRKDAWENRDDDARQELLLTAADAGAAMIDVMGDLYDPSPLELTRTPAAVEKQMRLIDAIHAKGADVVISSHMACFRSTGQVIEHLKTVEARGADVVKLVQTADTEQELEEAIRTTLALRRELKVPFIHLCNGKFARPHRFFGPTLGVSIFFAVQRYESGAGSQPTITAVKAVLDNLHWNINAT